MIIDMGYLSKVLKRLFILFISIVIFFLAMKLSIFYMPFLIALIISLLVEPLIKYVNKKSKLTRKSSAIIVLIIVFAILIGLLILGITTLISETSNLLKGFNIYFEKVSNFFENTMSYINFEKINLSVEIQTLIKNSINNFLLELSNIVKNLLNSIVNIITALPTIGIYIAITLIATYFICVDRLFILDQLEHHFPRTWVKRFTIHFKEISSSLGCYLKAEAILVLISFVILLIGLTIFKFCKLNVQYPLLIALGIGFIDALPILGSRNCNDSMDNYNCHKWRHEFGYLAINSLYYNDSHKATNRTKNSQ